MSDRNTLWETILKGKGDRTYRKYGEDTGVSYSNIQRLVHKQYIPTPETKSQGLFHQIQEEVTFCGLLHEAYA